MCLTNVIPLDPTVFSIDLLNRKLLPIYKLLLYVKRKTLKHLSTSKIFHVVTKKLKAMLPYFQIIRFFLGGGYL